MICNNCGVEVAEGMKFCGECGTKQDVSTEKSTSGLSMGDKNVIAGDVTGTKFVDEIRLTPNDSIKEAMEKFANGGTIYLEPGVYREQFNFDRDVRLVGVTGTADIMEKSSAELPIVVLDKTKTCKITSNFVEIEGVVFTRDENLSFEKLKDYVLQDYEPDYNQELLFLGEEGYTLFEVAGKEDAKIRISNSAILNSSSTGISFTTKCDASIQNSVICNSFRQNILCKNNSQPYINECYIRTESVNILVHDNSNPRVENTTICKGTGILVRAQASGTYENCHIHDLINNTGLVIYGSSTPIFKNCKIHDGNLDALVYVGGTANPTLTDCEIYNGEGVGIVVLRQARGKYTHCHLHDNNVAGVKCEDTSSSSFKDCTINNNTSNGIWINDNATPIFTNCKIHDNTEGTLVSVCCESNPTLTDCEIYNADYGIRVCDIASGKYTRCYVHDTKYDAFINETVDTIDIDTSTCKFK